MLIEDAAAGRGHHVIVFIVIKVTMETMFHFVEYQHMVMLATSEGHRVV